MEDQAHPARLEAYSTAPDDLIGRVLDGRYLIDAVLGRGAMAVVLGGRHMFLGRRVAIKVLHPALMVLEEMKARFLREARAASGIVHEAVVSVSDFGVATTESGSLHYLVMEHLEGEDLLTWSQRRGMASAAECVAIGAQLADALAAIHAAGYVHRDVKPENIWVMGGADGALRVKLLDLGIAAVIGDGDGDPSASARDHRLTRAGQTLGTVLYMSPEQTLGGAVDGRSDIYSLGCVLWELACDRCAFDGTSPMDIMLKQTSLRVMPPSSLNPTLPAWFDAIVMRCLEKRPEARFPSARALREALLAPRAEPVAPRAESVPARASRPLLWLSATFFVAVALVALVIAGPWAVEDDPAAALDPRPARVVPATETRAPATSIVTVEPAPAPLAQPTAQPAALAPATPPVAAAEPTATEPTAAPPATTTKKPTPRPKPATSATPTGQPATSGGELWRPERPTSPR